MLLASAPIDVLASGAGAQPQWTILACLDTRCGLSQEADHYQAGLAAVCRKLALPLAVQRLSSSREQPDRITEKLVWLEQAGWRVRRQGPIGEVPQAIGRAVAETFRLRPARHTMLLIVGHGTGLLEADETLGMDAADLGQALGDAAAQLGGPLDVLGLDTCFGGSLEKLFELQGSARYVTAAPGVIYSPGLRWDEALSRTVHDDPRELAVQVAELGMARGTEPAALVSVEVSKLAAVVEELKALAGPLVDQLPRNGHQVTFVRSRATSWGRRQELCDLGSLASGFEQNSFDPDLALRAARLRQALNSSIIGSWWSPGQPGDGRCGVGAYFPATFEAIPASYQRLRLAAASGWYHFLDLYWAWVSSLVGGQAHPAQ